MERKRLLKLFLIMGIISCLFAVSCVKKQSPDGGTSTQQDQQPVSDDTLERSISIIYPINAENMRQISETEIKDSFQTMLKTLFPESKKNVLKAMKRNELNTYIYDKLTNDTQIKSILEKFKTNGVVLSIGPEVLEGKKITRYGDEAHKTLARTSTNAVLNYLNATGERDSFLAKLQTNEFTFVENVQKEDVLDYVFELGAISGGITLRLKLLVLEFSISFNMDDVVTISHFWNPDLGWNAGLTEFYPKMRNYAISMVSNNATAQFLFLPEEIPNLVDMALAVASNFLDQEYLMAIVKNPPSSYFKALCYWYGWKNIKVKYIAPGGVYVGTIDTLEEFKPGVFDLSKTNPGLAAIYLAHIMHLVQDATVPAHAHCDTHASQPELGGRDFYENFVVNKFITNIVEKNSYRFKVSGNAISEFNKYTISNLQESVPLSQQGLFYQKVDDYYQMLQGTYGLWPLFFNAAQAAQFFPTFKQGMILSKWGNKNITNGTYLLDQSDTVSSSNNQAYNDPAIYDMSYAPADPTSSAAYSEKGTYYLIYNGSSQITDTDAQNAVVISNGTISVNGDFTLMYIGSPFDKMADSLVPIAVAASTRLARNYYRMN